MRTVLTALASLISGAVLLGPPPATSAEGLTCAGLPVTINLADPDHPDPDRARSDVVLGHAGSDWVELGAGDDVICAGDGDDSVTPGAGDDIVIGGPGRDSVSYRSAPGPVTVDLRLTDPQPTGWGSDTLRGVEAVQGTDRFSNHLVGNARDNDLSGGNVDDYIHGKGGDDHVRYGEDGDDEVRGGTGDDHVNGGRGRDLAVGGPGDDALCSGWDIDVDILRGGAGSDWVGSCGGEGSRDHVYGGAGDDELYAYTSDETLDGGEGFDVLSYGNVYRFAGAGVTVDLALEGPQDTVYSGTDEIADVEGLEGTVRRDVLSGDDGPNWIDGNRAIDVVDARGGHDVCVDDPKDTISNCEQLE